MAFLKMLTLRCTLFLYCIFLMTHVCNKLLKGKLTLGDDTTVSLGNPAFTLMKIEAKIKRVFKFLCTFSICPKCQKWTSLRNEKKNCVSKKECLQLVLKFS